MSPADRINAADVKAAPGINKDATKAIDDKLLMDKKYRELQKTDAPAAERYRTDMITKEAARMMGGAPAAAAPAVAKPSMQVFMDAARKANPGVSDADLAAYYNSKYK
jgi:hypothetical protein